MAATRYIFSITHYKIRLAHKKDKLRRCKTLIRLLLSEYYKVGTMTLSLEERLAVFDWDESLDRSMKITQNGDYDRMKSCMNC